MTLKRKELGKKGENYAKLYLQRNHYQILEQNWQCRSGELDLIALHQEQLVIVEVRTRTISLNSQYHFGAAEESIDVRKQTKVRKLAQLYIHQQGYQYKSARFDVITVYVTHDNGRYEINHYENAF